ncbi:MAG TPA: DMT family transporter [Rubrivivax sp.]|nr:DMT family transporter [Rubrivivax sp.]
MGTDRAARRTSVLAVLALSFNAFVWGVSWWPLRQLEARGLHPLWATALIYLLAVAIITLAHPRAWRDLARAPSLWWLVAAAGMTNATFNWGVTIGDVVRVVLLFYLMPLWAVLLARVLLAEQLTPLAALRVVLALAGAAIVLWPADGGGWPLPRTLGEWLGLAGGFAFALNNVLLRREAGQPDGVRALAMFLGGALVPGVLALVLGLQGQAAWPPPAAAGWVAGALALAVVFLAGNFALQYGAARLRASATAVVMITEVLFASVSAVALGAGVLTSPLLLGGALIVLAALLAARAP